MGGAGGEAFAVGTTVGRYVVLGLVGTGAMGVVYAAYDPDLDRKVALKLLKPQTASPADAARKERLLREARATAKLSDPNVVVVHDVGTVGDQLFLAMEFLPGGTLRGWLDVKTRTWREIVKVFAEVGRGLNAAHAEGFIHRDFKPENVLFDKEGRPRVVDFGLARLASEDARAAPPEERARPEAHSLDASPTALTRTGVVIGTPAYMAPEQFLGQAIDARTDQFTFCAALYEALYKQRPFPGDTFLALAASVTDGKMRALPRDSQVPVWVRRVIVRGLSTRPEDRFPSMEALLRALTRDPSIVLRRRLGVGGVAVVVSATLFLAHQIVTRRRQQIERQVAGLLAESQVDSDQARQRDHDLQVRRRQAFEAFDSKDSALGEKLWRQVILSNSTVDALYGRATASAEAALHLDPRDDIRGRIAGLLQSRILLAEQQGREEERASLLQQLSSLAPGDPFLTNLNRPVPVQLALEPSGARVSVERYEKRPGGSRQAVPAHAGVVPAAARLELAPGSYRFRIDAAGFVGTYLPFVVKRGQPLSISFALAAKGAVPEGFAVVPGGAFLFGDADEALRQNFLKTAPLHESTTESFIISRTEVTFADWLQFLEALPPAERRKRTPKASAKDIVFQRGEVELFRSSSGAWQLSFTPASQRYSAAAGEALRYEGRANRTNQRWERMPVVGVSVEDSLAYFAWLDRTGRVKGARLCTEKEWERAARGADDRLYPHGDYLEPDDANHDVTYGRRPAAFGPDEVGSYPATRSPFGVDDLVGNVWEPLRSSLEPDAIAVRGGGFYYKAADARLTNREPFEATARGVHFGIRVCADLMSK